MAQVSEPSPLPPTDPANRRRRVLLSAYACEPGKGSEPGVGWHWALQAARHHEVWVLTRANNRAAIEAACAAEGTGSIRFCFYDLPPWIQRRKRSPAGLRAYYVLWQLGALRVARRLHLRVGFDVVHHVTFNTMDVPGFLWLLGPPFVWGPVGGGQEPPEALREYFGRRWPAERLRVLWKRAARFNPLVRAAVRHAAAIMVANGETERRLRQLGALRCVRELETAVDLPPPASAARSSRDAPFTILWVGSLILRKGPRLALDALTELKRRGVEFRARFVGEGELATSMPQWVRDRRLDSEVEMIPRVPYGEIGRWYAESDVLLFTSLHDTSGNVVLEALAHGLPVVGLDQHGVSDMLDASCGFKVGIVSRDQVVSDLAAHLAWLAADAHRRRDMGAAGRRRVESQYDWNHKGDLLRRLYAEAAHPARSPAADRPGGAPVARPAGSPDAHSPRP